MAESIEMHPKDQEVEVEEIPLVAETQCGFLCWKPACLQRFARPVSFLIAMCLFVGIDGLNMGIVTGTITSLEARYQFTLTEMGIMLTALAVAGFFGLLLVMYLGSRPGSSKPRLIGICGIFSSVGVFIQCLPQFLYDPYQPPGGSSQVPGETNLTGPGMMCAAMPEEVCLDDTPVDSSPDNRVAYWVLFTGNLLQNVALTGIYPLGITYMADCTSEGTASFYIGIMNSIFGLGPVIGVFLAAATISLWVDFYRLENGTELNISPDNPGWVGAWWLGLLIIAILLCIFSIQFLFFPRRLPEKARNQPKDYQEVREKMNVAEDDREIPKKHYVKDFILEVWRTLKNPYCSLTCISHSTFFFIVFGYGTFIPKYLEVQFGYHKRTADLLTGVLLAPAYAFGEFMGGLLVKKLNLKLRGIIRLSCGVLVASALGFIFLTFIGCDNDNVAGVFSSYSGLSSETSMKPTLEDACNQNCFCSLAVYSPVCSGDGLTYFSPCHAGCTQATDNNTYTECACLAMGNSSASDGLEFDSVVDGACGTNCVAAIPFLVILTVIFVLATFSDLLRMTIIIRSSSSENRLLALSLTYMTQLIGGIPAGIVFGSLIDSSCLVWQQSCQDEGACLLYDLHSLRLAFNGVPFGASIFGAAVMFIVMCLPQGKFDKLPEA